MPSDSAAWDARYRDELYPAGTEPAPIVREFLPLLPRGCALDLAMGGGRNAVFLAACGWRVVGIDSSRAALDNAEALAHERGVKVQWASPPSLELSAKLPGLLLLQADLERIALPPARFDLVLCIKYLQRSLFTAIERALRPGGALVYETYTVDQLAFPHGPRSPDHLLRSGELRAAFPGLKTLFYREFCAGRGIATLLARKP